MADFVFWLSLCIVFYVYFGYPVLLFVVALGRSRDKLTSDELPTVSILIAAHNERDVIEKTIENKLALDYDKRKLEIIVISDGSTDGTDELIKEKFPRKVRLLRQEPRQGKTSGLNMAVEVAKGEILVFSDANSLYRKNALKMLVRNFADPSVGYVTGQMVYGGEDTLVGAGCSAYMRYENLLREIETKVESVVGVDGGVDACRKALYKPMNADQLPDFVLPLTVVDQGYRVVYESEAMLSEDALKATADEYRMRVRVSLRAFWALWDMRHLLKFKFPLFGWQLWSHKVLRYLCPVFLLAVALLNLLLLAEGGIYVLTFIAQFASYLLAALPEDFAADGKLKKAAKLCRYFALINIASGHALFKFMMREKMVTWTPRKGA